MRSLKYVLLLAIIGLVLAIWSPWNSWNISLAQLFGIEPPPEAAGLAVSSLAGTIQIEIDNVRVGEVSPQNSPLVIPGIAPGERRVKLLRSSDVPGAFVEYSRLLNFVSDVDVVISYELGPTDDFSEGHVIFVTENRDNSGLTYLNINTEPSTALVALDGVSIGSSPIVLYPISLDRQHVLTVTANGYETQEFRILPASQEDRDKIRGYNINADVRLFLQPLQVR